MSLDVYLTLDGYKGDRIGSGIFVRAVGQNKEISREEWDRAFPGREPVIVSQDEESDGVYSANITHNLGRMASEAHLYEALWRPEEIGITAAGQLIKLLRDGLVLLESDRPRFEQFNPSNGWGDYVALVSFVQDYLAACERYPAATVTVSR